MATALTAFLPLVQPSVPGCPEKLILGAIRGACIRFCTETTLIRETLPAITVAIGTDEYTLTPAESSKESVGIVHLIHDNRDMGIKTEEELDIIDQGWRVADPGVAFYATMLSPDVFKLNRVPAEEIIAGLVPHIATRPVDTATEVDDLIYNDWRSGIKHGALNTLKEIPDKKWSSEKDAHFFGKEFNYYIQSGKARARMGHGLNKSTGAKMRSWI